MAVPALADRRYSPHQRHGPIGATASNKLVPMACGAASLKLRTLSVAMTCRHSTSILAGASPLP
jgi:hypothetical protein